MKQILWTAFPFAFGVLAIVIGCESKLDPQIKTLRDQFVVDKDIADAVTLTEAKEKLVEEQPIVLVGRIGTGKLEAFDRQKARFVLAEAPIGDHATSKGHDVSDCVFCRRRMEAAPLAYVEWRDQNNQPIPFSADKLLNIREGQIVVVRGQGRYEPNFDTLSIIGQSIYVRSRD
jgi:hypothetical protein